MGVVCGPPERRHERSAGLPELPCEKGTCWKAHVEGERLCFSAGPQLVACVQLFSTGPPARRAHARCWALRGTRMALRSSMAGAGGGHVPDAMVATVTVTLLNLDDVWTRKMWWLVFRTSGSRG